MKSAYLFTEFFTLGVCESQFFGLLFNLKNLSERYREMAKVDLSQNFLTNLLALKIKKTFQATAQLSVLTCFARTETHDLTF